MGGTPIFSHFSPILAILKILTSVRRNVTNVTFFYLYLKAFLSEVTSFISSVTQNGVRGLYVEENWAYTNLASHSA